MGQQDGSACGAALLARSMRDLPIDSFGGPRVVLVDRLNGTDDIPSGTVAVLAANATDILSHVAIRARNQGVLLASCDDELMRQLKDSFQDGQTVCILAAANGGGGDLDIRRGDVLSVRQPLPTLVRSYRKFELQVPRATHACVVGLDGFRQGLVGAKSRHLAKLAASVPAWIRVPRSVALPFGSMEAALGLKENDRVAAAISRHSKSAQAALQRSDLKAMTTALSRIRRELTTELRMDDCALGCLNEILATFGHPSTDLDELWDAIRRVWASKWTSRAFLSRARHGIPDSALCMAVLVQEVIPAEYAFVMHTIHPVTRDPDSMLGEVVAGLGETLVGNSRGRPFGFLTSRSAPEDVFKIVSYPSKTMGLFADAADSGGAGLMVRSDSNGEDLDHFAGAGLYESVLCGSVREEALDYSDSPLFVDEGFRKRLIRTLRDTAIAVEGVMGNGAQDIEGVVGKDGSITVVQTRRQII